MTVAPWNLLHCLQVAAGANKVHVQRPWDRGMAGCGGGEGDGHLDAEVLSDGDEVVVDARGGMEDRRTNRDRGTGKTLEPEAWKRRRKQAGNQKQGPKTASEQHESIQKA